MNLARIKKFFTTKKYFPIFALILITIIGGYFRAFHFSDTLFFEIDQARDYQLLNEVLHKGLGDFPLVGPKAGGTEFRLGPLYYILPLIISFIFGASPYALAIPELIFSILTIPLLYFFAREFFSKKLAFFCVSIFATSLFAVEYAHFSWNPNAIPFFILLSLYSALRYSRAKTKKIAWLALMTFSAAVAMQLHTLALIGIPPILVIYFIATKTKISFKGSFAILIVLITSFSFLIGNDLLTKGENTQEFVKAIFLEGDDEDRATTGKKVLMTSHSIAQFYSTFTTSQKIIDRPGRVKSSKDLGDFLRRNKAETENWNNLIKSGLIFAIICFGFFLALYYLKHAWLDKEKNPKKYNFLVLLISWQIIYAIILFPLSLSLNVRFLLPIAFIPFFLLCLYSLFLEEKFKKYGTKIVFVIWGLFLFSNLIGTTKWLHAINNYGTSDNDTKENEFILESYYIVTMSQWQDIATKISKLASKKEHRGVYISASPFHIRPILFLLQFGRKIPTDQLNDDAIVSGGSYFAIQETINISDDKMLPKNLKEDFLLISQHNFGTVTLLEMKLKNPELHAEREILELPTHESTQARCYESGFSINRREKCTIRDLKYLFEN